MARRVLEMGAKGVAVWDINEASLGNTVEELSKLGTAIGVKVDVSDFDAVGRAYR